VVVRQVAVELAVIGLGHQQLDVRPMASAAA
jgi:hypothetical protein